MDTSDNQNISINLGDRAVAAALGGGPSITSSNKSRKSLIDSQHSDYSHSGGDALYNFLMGKC